MSKELFFQARFQSIERKYSIDSNYNKRPNTTSTLECFDKKDKPKNK